MTLERRIARRNAGRRTVKTGTVAVAVGATAATGILTAALAHPTGEPATAPASITVTPAAADAPVKTKKPKPPKATPVAVKPTPAPKPKPANTSGS